MTDDPEIAFLCDPELEGTLPKPDRAIRFAPDWFKDLPREMDIPDADGKPGMTVKACLPVTDAFALGYVIPLPYETHIRVPQDQQNMQFGWPHEVAFQPIEFHHPGQIGAPAPPFGPVTPLKFVNPWRIRVPDGYSVLFTTPLSRPDLPFQLFSGFVDCDKFATTINFPFLWRGGVGDFVLPAGMPMVQLIAIRRDTLIKDHVARGSSEEELDEQAHAHDRKYNSESAYAREWRVKK
ncbi:hypothetical protein [Aurantiacibacter sp. MUD61]|uniref:hypothetical protein n=1 Tax=Aurantiacibacter sp. MUD61 TaxID=3009083 RepID=UPI0022EFE2AE|nr:hypothetical protein [Aurantiacibacter sp. MUD61]